MMQVRALRAFSDNYIWLLDRGGEDAFVVDPGDAGPVLAALAAERLRLAGILVTHHHPDHTGGVHALCAQWPGIPVYGARNGRCDAITHRVGDGDRVPVLGGDCRVIEVPGHTLDHIAYFFAGTDAPPALFCGDTLFAGGCGRMFEGDARGMHASLGRLAALPDNTRVYCAHEYTLSNLRFARAVEPENPDLLAREAADRLRRENDGATVPSTLDLELRTNPFLRCSTPAVRQAAAARAGRELAADHEVFGVIRAWKDGFR